LHNGYIDIVKAEVIKNGSMSGDRILSWIMDQKDSIDIDTKEDF